MEYYLAIIKNEILSFVATWMNLENIILSEVSQTKTNMISFILQNLKNNTNGSIYNTERDSQT